MKATWKSALYRLCIVNNMLILPLGQWTTSSHQLWKYMIEEETGRLLKYDGTDQWVHYNTRKTMYKRRCRKSHPTAPGIPVKVSVLPVGYKVINNNKVSAITVDHENTKISVCTMLRKSTRLSGVGGL